MQGITRLRATALVAAALVGMLVAAGSTRDARAADAAVAINNFAFTPAALTVTVGDRVTWTNNQAGVPHTATSNTGVTPAFDTGNLATGASGSVTFNTAGTFAYHCTIHPNMAGTITVLAATAITPTATAATPTATASPTAAATATPTRVATTAPTTATGASPTSAPAGTATVAPGAPATGSGLGTESDGFPTGVVLLGAGVLTLALVGLGVQRRIRGNP